MGIKLITTVFSYTSALLINFEAVGEAFMCHIYVIGPHFVHKINTKAYKKPHSAPLSVCLLELIEDVWSVM